MKNLDVKWAKEALKAIQETRVGYLSILNEGYYSDGFNTRPNCTTRGCSFCRHFLYNYDKKECEYCLWTVLERKTKNIEKNAYTGDRKCVKMRVWDEPISERLIRLCRWESRIIKHFFLTNLKK